MKIALTGSTGFLGKELLRILNDKKFDVIVDTNLKSYSCCHESFDFFMENLLTKLENGGILITSKNGMRWFKELKPKLSFNFKNFFYYKLKEVSGNKENILTTNELINLSKRYNLEFSFSSKAASKAPFAAFNSLSKLRCENSVIIPSSNS